MFQRLPAIKPLLAAIGLALLTLVALYLLPTPTRAATPIAATPNTADVVVQFGDGLVVTRRITFTGTISGLAALRLTGLPLVEKNGTVCRIGDTGCAANQDCFCACPPPYSPCLFWGYKHWAGSAWVDSAQGAAQTTVTNGAVEGWTWGRTLPPVSPAILGGRAGLQWLKPLQNANGSYGGSGGNAGATIDTVLANRAFGGAASDWRSNSGASLLDALTSLARPYAARDAASVGKLMLGVAAADQDPRSFAGLNLVISATATLNTTTGAYGATNWDQAFAILGLRATSEAVPANAITLLKGRANADGGWGYTVPGASDVDSTGLVLQALAAAGVAKNDAVVVKALNYLDSLQKSDGGFPYDASAGNESNVNSTSYALQGILAAGSDPTAARWKPSASNPISYLLSLQTPEGAFTYGGDANLFATQQAIPALAGRPFPYLSKAVARRLGLEFIKSQQQANGSFAGFNPGSTIDAVLAIDAAGDTPQSYVSSAGKRPLDYLAPQAATYAASSAAASGKLLVGVVAADANPRNFAGLNLVISTTVRYNHTTGAFGPSTFDQAWSILGLAAAGETVPLSATARLEAMKATGGGWGFDANAAAGDADSTGLALQALAAAGATSATNAVTTSDVTVCTTGAGSTNPVVQEALAFLRNVQNADGGFPGYGGDTSAGSTGLGLQGLAAFHDTPRGLSWTTTITNGASSALTLHNPVDTLQGLQTGAGGFPGFSGPNDPSSSYQALPGLLGQAFPASKRTILYFPVMRR